MIEILGYVFLYLIVGVVLLPFTFAADKLVKHIKDYQTKGWLYVSLFFWPAYFPLAIALIWAFSWKEFKNYK